MPEFRDDQGRVMIWDPTSKSYVVDPDSGLSRPDRGHATGGDNDLFDPFQHTEQAGVPELEGYMAHTAAEWSPPGQVRCPNCETTTDQQVCPGCGKGLTPEWNQEQGNEFFDAQVPHSNASEFTSWPERVPKRNRLKTDDAYPSVTTASAYDMAVKLAHTHLSADEWDDLFSGASPTKVEIGKWLIDKGGNLHIDHGMHALHEQIAARDGINYPGDVGALGSVYNDGSADTQRVFPDYQFDLQTAQAQITQAFGPVTLQPPVGQSGSPQKGEAFEPFEIRGGQWVVAPHFAQHPLTGVAWVKERPDGRECQPNMILVAEHIQPEDFALWSRGVTAIVTATGGLTSHAAYLASTEGIPVVVGIGESYNKIETGNYLKVDPATQTITVMPGASATMNPDQKQNVWDSYLQYQRQRGGSLKPEYFAHIDDELTWREANNPTLDSCPECHQPMVDQGGESVCHGCGHKQPIIQSHAAVLAPLGEAAMGGLVGGGEAGGIAAAGGGGLSGVGGLMQKALNGVAFRGGENMLGGGGGAGAGEGSDSGADTQGVISKTASDDDDDDEVGRATQNRGDDSNPDTQTSSGSDAEEHGDSPEQLKDVEGLGGASEGDDPTEKKQGDPALQDKALKAFHMNMPLVIEFAHSDEPGADNPILRALDELLEEAFPGYKDGHDDAAAESEHPVEEIHEEIHPEEKSDEDDSDDDDSKSNAKEASLWHFATGLGYDEHPSPEQDFGPDHGHEPYVCPNCEHGTHDYGNGTCQHCGEQLTDREQDPHDHLAELDAEQAPGHYDMYGPDQPTWHDMFPHEATSHEAVSLGDGQYAAPNAGGFPANNGDLNAMQQAAPTGVPTCPTCGQSHLPGTPCPTPVAPTAQVPAPAAAGGQVTPPQPQTVVTKWQVVTTTATERFDEAVENLPEVTSEQNPDAEAAIDPEFAFFAATGEGEHHLHHEVEHHPHHEDSQPQDDPSAAGSPWTDESGAPLQEGADYELKSSDYAIPDRITVDRVLPDKLVFTIHSGDVDYRDEISTEDVQTNGYSFSPAGGDDSQVDSIDGFQPEAPIRPGQDALPQQDDLSNPSTVVSHESFAPVSLDSYTGSFNGDAPDARSWLMRGNSSEVAVDPEMMAKFAGKGFSPREQREFIDERGEARNLDRLDLSGTHYIADDIDAAFNW